MTRIHLLFLLLIPTVLSSHFKLDLCGAGQEFVCFIRDVCKGDAPEDKMVNTMKDALNYDKTRCDLHVMIKQYNTSSYFIRFIAETNEIKLVRGSTFFGCEWKNGRMSEIKSESSHFIKLHTYQLIPPDQKNGNEMLCELSVTYTNEEKIFGMDDMFVEYKQNVPKQELNTNVIGMMLKSFDQASNKCNPGSIHFGGSEFEDGGYAIKPITAHIGDASCPKHYIMAVEGSDGIEEVDSITCEMEKINGCHTKSPPDCDWKYFTRGKKEKAAPDEFKAACRRKTCKMCPDPKRKLKCEGGNSCKAPIFSEEGECHTLMCERGKDNGGENIVMIDGGNTTFGKFECTNNGDENIEPRWMLIERTPTGETETRNFTTATCYDTINCEDYSPLKLNCDGGAECPKVDKSTHNVTCPSGFDLKLFGPTGQSHQSTVVKCDQSKGIYHFKEGKGDAVTTIDGKEWEVACARQDPVAASTGMELWQWILIIVVIVVVLALLIFCIFFYRRKKKTDEAKKALLKKNDSQQSSTDSNKPQIGGARVQMQCSTAKQISSEQPSEGTAKEKTNKELVEKTVLEPTIDPRTALSTTKSRKESKRETGSLDNEIIDDAKRSSKEGISIPEESNASVKAGDSKVSKKETKGDKLKPRKFELNEKEKQIAKGVWRRNEDYPTMADIESDWDDAKDGKIPSKQRTATKDIPTADTPSARAGKGAELNEKTAEMERLLDQPQLKLQRVTASEDPKEEAKANNGSEESRASVRKTTNKFSTVMGTLDVTQDQK